jgi:hypothetical protein
MILNLEESVNFFAIWPGIAPYLCIDCALKVIKYTIFNFPSLKGSTILWTNLNFNQHTRMQTAAKN